MLNQVQHHVNLKTNDDRLKMGFPTYRKYKNNKNFFKIINENEFEEISFIGSKVVVTKHLAKILPDRNLISDLLNDSNVAEKSTKEEYESYLIK